MTGFKRSTILILSILIISLIPISLVKADTYSSPWISLYSSQGGGPDTTMQVYGYRFTPGSLVNIGLAPSGSQPQGVGSVIVDSKGNFIQNVPIPTTAKVDDKWTVSVAETQNGATLNNISLDFAIGHLSSIRKVNSAPLGGAIYYPGTYYGPVYPFYGYGAAYFNRPYRVYYRRFANANYFYRNGYFIHGRFCNGRWYSNRFRYFRKRWY